ncbi:cytochrome P450 [Heliocybe sulcata]|uniref:Cytochrome P450 n=1 Tax=Heliocybe sulcata TaxID=5364 RepID=A0A5C3MIX8_9AGAM|nr:cytochrome P450 [Heliocybe sulcata]
MRFPAPLPPGPLGLPVVGNAFDLPRSQPWITFRKWAEIYGPIVYVSAFGQSIIVLNDSRYAIDMLNKKSRIYNGRPKLIMAGDLIGWGEGPALTQPSDRWSEYRRLLSQFIGTKAKMEGFTALLEQEVDMYVQRINSTPEEWVRHTRRLAGSIVLRMAYGYTPSEEDDMLVNLVDEAMEHFSEATGANAFLVDVFPILRYIPEWFPGATWKRKARLYHATLQEMLNRPYNWAKERIMTGVSEPCFLSDQLSRKNVTREEEHTLKWAAAGIYSGGADTTVAGIEVLFLAMTIHPDEQKKAQAELDAVVGSGQAPCLADRERLPYVQALYLETLRFYTFGPTGLPHLALEDDVHEEYFIPKGSIIMTNVAGYYKDPKTYPDPNKFQPERFLSTLGQVMQQDPRDFLFGFGRRACPGVHLADATMWLVFASLLATFHIEPPVKDGKPVFPTGKFTDGSISHPETFECIIKRRQ